MKTRVAVIPAGVATLVKAGLQVSIEHDAGTAAGFPDESYQAQGADLVARSELFATSNIVLQVRAMPADQTVIGLPIRSARRWRSTTSPPPAWRCSRWS